MARGDQAEILAVLRDRIAADGGAALEVRQWVADNLHTLGIVGEWADLSDGVACYTMDGRFSPLIASVTRTRSGRYTAEVEVAHGQLVDTVPTLEEAKAAADEELRKLGKVLRRGRDAQ